MGGRDGARRLFGGLIGGVREHLGDERGVALGDDVAFEFEGACHFIADLKGLGDKTPGGDAFERFESVGVVDEFANIVIDQLVGFLQDDEFANAGDVDSSQSEVLEGRHDEGGEAFLVLADDHALVDVGGFDETGLDGDGFDIFTVEKDDGILGAAKNFQGIVEGYHADVAGVHPSVAEHAGSGFGVFVVAAHDLRAFDVNLAAKSASTAAAGGVGIENRTVCEIHNAHFGVGIKGPDASDDEILPCANSEDWCGFGHAIAFKNGDADEVEKLINMGL